MVHNHDESHVNKVDAHELKGEMIKELSPYYNHHDLSLFGKM